MANLKATTILLAMALSALIIFTSEDRPHCFDADLYSEHKYDLCIMECSGVTGLDGNTYCNECEANRLGIHVIK